MGEHHPLPSNFITNANTKTLKERIKELIEASKEFKFLVGFFYFSGFQELYTSLKNNQDSVMKVLVGLNVDQHTKGFLIETPHPSNISSQKNQENFIVSLKKVINSELSDHPDFYRHINLLLELITSGKLIIRKTIHPNHAKLYLFKLKEGIAKVKPSLFITGSSNLTKAGLSEQGEFNVEISDYGVDEAEKYFDELWETSTLITEVPEYRQRIIHFFNSESIITPVKPYEAYAYVIKTYLDAQKPDLEYGIDGIIERMQEKGYTPYKYQLDAISQGFDTLEKYNGVILADVVGLGKTVIACAIARLLRKRGIIITPPSLIGDQDTYTSGWAKYKEEFGLFDWKICSAGKLDIALELIRKNSEYEVIIIDEAHKFRNQDTRSYEYLSNICRGKKVILLTATPFSNAPNDIFSLIKLFTIPKHSKLTLDEDLDFLFSQFRKTFQKLSYIRKNYNTDDPQKMQKLTKYTLEIFNKPSVTLNEVKQETKKLANTIKAIIQPVVIRRNRLDLQNDPEYSDEVNNLSTVCDPIELFYELTTEQSVFYDSIVRDYFSENGKFNGAIYRPYWYEKDLDHEEIEDDIEYNNLNKRKSQEQREKLSQKNLYDLMRRLLVKRLESSFGSFYQSLKNFLEIHKKCLNFIKKTNKFILDRQLLEKISEYDPEDIEEELQKFADNIEKTNSFNTTFYKIYELDKLKENFSSDIESDIGLFEELIKKVEALGIIENDPKAKRIAEELPKIIKKHSPQEPPRKVVIFTEYKDTVNHLATQLKKLLPSDLNSRILTVTSKLGSDNYETLLSNFDASYHKQKNNYDILITTDRLSEGFNLNRAGAVINYDIPWNPTRVIQRVGRINRISKKVFNELYIYNYFPTEKGAEFVKSREIASQKMFLIHNALGEDAKIFEPDEEPTSAELYARINFNPDKMEDDNFITKLKKTYLEIEKYHPEVIEKISKLPQRVKSAKAFSFYNLNVFIKKGKNIFVRYIDSQNQLPLTLTLEQSIQFIEAQPDEPLLQLSDSFWKNYHTILQNRTSPSPIQLPTTDNWTKAKNLIETILKTLPTELEAYREFLEALRNDLLYYKTLSDYTVKKLLDLTLDENHSYKKFIEMMDSLMKEIDINTLKKIEDTSKFINPEIIIAIENIPKNSVAD